MKLGAFLSILGNHGKWLPSDYCRVALPAWELQKHGYDVVLGDQLAPTTAGHIAVRDHLTGTWHPDCDIIVGNRELHYSILRDEPPGAAKVKATTQVIERAVSCGQAVIWDFDDDPFVGSLAKWFSLDVSWIAEVMDPAVAAFSAVTVSTERLRRLFSRFEPPVYLLRNAIDLERWLVLDPGRPLEEAGDGYRVVDRDRARGFIGWVGVTGWRAAEDLPTLSSVLPRFLEDHDLAFYHGGYGKGAEPAWDQLGIDTSATSCASHGQVDIWKYPQIWEPVNVALVPLEKCRFNESKSYLKSLEASASGLPYVVSDIGPEQRLLIEEGGAGRLARGERQWRRHLEELLDPEVRRLEGKQNRAVAERHDIRERWVEWDAVYREVAGR